MKHGIDVLSRAYTIKYRWDHQEPPVNTRRDRCEVDDLISRVSLICATEAGVHAPSLDVPDTIVPGEQIVVRAVLGARADHDENTPTVRLLAVSAPLEFSLSDKDSHRIEAQKDGVGLTGQLEAVASVRLPSGLRLPMPVSARIRVVPPIEAKMRVAEISAAGDRFQLVVDVLNNASRPVKVNSHWDKNLVLKR